MAWYQEMSFLITKLNALTARTQQCIIPDKTLYSQESPDTPEENKTTKELLIQYARDPSNAALFNYASMAHNTHFHFTSLNLYADSDTPTPMPKELVTEVEKDFTSVDDLRTSLIDTADSMFGPGFVWLVRAKTPAPAGSGERERYSMRVLCTYLAGSPYAAAHYRAQTTDMNTQNSQSYREAAARGLSGFDLMRQTSLQNSVGSFGPTARIGQEKKISKGGTEVEPLLCVNMWEHAWLRDFGIYVPDQEGRWHSGKRVYLETWWRTVDWQTVWRRCEESVKHEKVEAQNRGLGGMNSFMYR